MSISGIEIRPEQVESELVTQTARRIRECLARNPGPAPIEVLPETDTAEALVLPRAVAVMLAQVLGLLDEGQAAWIIPESAMLTTQQAAQMLKVSRPYLVSLLDAREIDHVMAGTHRRIPCSSLIEYQRTQYRKRKEAVDELTKLGEELGED